MFILTSDGGLVPLKPAQFVLEDDFQRLLELYPDLLSGELIDPEEPRRWVLVSREIGIPAQVDGSGQWSADHLFLDQDGIPTIVEVKRQTDTRLRREVVGQMLEYAANAAAYWTVDSIRSSYEATCLKNGKDPDQELQEKLGAEIEGTTFWAQVKTNLEAQKIRLLFVADAIPRELRRIVEFLNRQMNPAEVLALELRQYAGENGLRTLAPTLFGQTEGARAQKAGVPGRTWDDDSFFTLLSSRFPPEIVASVRRITLWIKNNTSSGIIYGHGKVDGSITGYIRSNGLKLYPMMLMTSGRLYINFRDCMKPPFDDVSKRMDFLGRLNAIPGISLPDDCISRQPSIQISGITEPAKIEQLLKTMDWFVEQID